MHWPSDEPPQASLPPSAKAPSLTSPSACKQSSRTSKLCPKFRILDARRADYTKLMRDPKERRAESFLPKPNPQNSRTNLLMQIAAIITP
ncbi:hypothetical protein BYT27DRAFT_7255685 [Phlegmacium glaucopus]|nr:hypothetical protein BYT27DRAFT_7255685 [Phlegmacium glaucopus]